MNSNDYFKLMIKTTCQECGAKAFWNGRVWTHDYSPTDVEHAAVPTKQAANKLTKRN